MVGLQNIRELYRPSSRALYWIKGTIYAPPLARCSTLAAGSPNHPGTSARRSTFTLGHGARTVQVPLYAGTAAAPATDPVVYLPGRYKGLRPPWKGLAIFSREA